MPKWHRDSIFGPDPRVVRMRASGWFLDMARSMSRNQVARQASSFTHRSSG
jgi:hypothetical protein